MSVRVSVCPCELVCVCLGVILDVILGVILGNFVSVCVGSYMPGEFVHLGGNLQGIVSV